VPSVTPSEYKASTPSSVDTTLESKITATTPLIALSTLSENLTMEVTSSEEIESTEKFRITTLNPSSDEELGEQITVGEDIDDIDDITTEFPETSSEEIDSDEDETTDRITTEYPETVEPFNVNLTTSQLGNNKINSLLNYIIDA
jgi:hypothetical protein